MNWRTTCIVTSMVVSGLAMAMWPQAGVAQSDSLSGLWQINVAKSKYDPGPPPKSQTVYFQGEGQNRKVTIVGITAAGNPQLATFTEFVEDGKPHPVTGLAGTDAQTYTRLDARTLNVSRLKDGKVVQTGTWIVSPDGKALTVSFKGTNANGREVNNIFIYDKQ
jgi:hypothetical protein